MADELRALPYTFTFGQAVRHGISERTLYRLREEGLVAPIGRGLYRRHDAPHDVDLDLLEIAMRAPRATLCLTTALARHGLVDTIPPSIDVAVPRGSRKPAVSAAATWHLFDAGTFALGRTEVQLEGDIAIGLYSAERSIVDAARLRHLEGPELVYEALRNWLRRPKTSPAELLKIARRFPNAEPPLRKALEILL